MLLVIVESNEEQTEISQLRLTAHSSVERKILTKLFKELPQSTDWKEIEVYFVPRVIDSLTINGEADDEYPGK